MTVLPGVATVWSQACPFRQHTRMLYRQTDRQTDRGETDSQSGHSIMSHLLAVRRNERNAVHHTVVEHMHFWFFWFVISARHVVTQLVLPLSCSVS